LIDASLYSVVAYLALGAFAGTVAGLLGVGGGLIIVPVLALLFARQGIDPGILMHLAVGTSLATIVVTSISSVYSHHRHGAVFWHVFWRLVPGIVLGAGLGAWLASLLPTREFKLIFGVFELLVATQMLFGFKPSPHNALPGRLGLAAAGTVIGTISAIVGVGGGTLTVPFLTWCQVKIHNAIATSAACGLPIAIFGSIGFMITGSAHGAAPAYASGFVYWPAFLGIVIASALFAPLGARLAHRLSTKKLRGVFAVFLIGLGVWMLSGY
jgi:uncharacterized membrane protein YfcA